MDIKLPPILTSAEVKEIVQVHVIKQQNDLQKAGVIKLYESLEAFKTSTGDVYIASRGADSKKVTY